MLFSIRNIEHLEKLNELFSLESRVKAVRLQNKPGRQNFHEDMKKVFKPITKSIKDVTEEVTKTMTENSIENKQALENLNDKILETKNDRGIIASCLLSPLSKIISPEISTKFNLVKDSSSNRVNDLLLHKAIPLILHNNLLTFRDTGNVFELKRNLLKKITIKNYNVDLASLADKKLIYDFAREMNFDVKAMGNKSTRDKTFIKLLKLFNLMVCASGYSNKFFLSSDPDELRDRLKLLLQEKQAGNNSGIINDKIVAVFHKLLKYKCIPKKQHRKISNKCNLLRI